MRIVLMIFLCLGGLWSLSPKITAGGDSVLPHGFVEEPEGTRWMNSDGSWASDQWLSTQGERYHFDADGYLQTGFTRIGDETYYLEPQMRVGWLYYEGGLYFFRRDGSMTHDFKSGNLQFGTDGKLSIVTPKPKETKLRRIVKKILSEIITEGMTPEEQLKACYFYMIDHSTYERFYEAPSGEWTWTREYAEYILTTGQGNCYRYASGLAYLVKELGFDVKVITGEVKARRGGTTPHSWVEICLDGTWYLFDCELQDANGIDLYQKTYGNYPIQPLNKLREWKVEF